MSTVVALNSRQETLNNLGDYEGANFTVESRPIFFKEQVHYPNPDDIFEGPTDEELQRIENELEKYSD